MVFLTFLTFYTLRGSLDTKVRQKETFSINGERLVAVEHAMFKFEGLKVNSRDDRQNDNLSTQLSPPMLKRARPIITVDVREKDIHDNTP